MLGKKMSFKKGAFSYEARIIQVGRKIIYLHMPGKGILKMRNGVVEGYELGKSMIHMDYKSGCFIEEQATLPEMLKIMPKRSVTGHHEEAWSK